MIKYQAITSPEKIREDIKNIKADAVDLVPNGVFADSRFLDAVILAQNVATKISILNSNESNYSVLLMTAKRVSMIAEREKKVSISSFGYDAERMANLLLVYAYRIGALQYRELNDIDNLTDWYQDGMLKGEYAESMLCNELTEQYIHEHQKVLEVELAEKHTWRTLTSIVMNIPITEEDHELPLESVYDRLLLSSVSKTKGNKDMNASEYLDLFMAKHIIMADFSAFNTNKVKEEV